MAQTLLAGLMKISNTRFSMMPFQETTRSSPGRQLVVRTAACVLSVVTAALILAGSNRAEATIINAADCSLSSVQAACSVASPGDTVQVPPGTAAWTNCLTLNKGIQLLGAGIDQTIIVDEENRSSNPSAPMISWQTVSNGFARLSGFTFKGGVINTQMAYQGSVVIGGTCHAFRLDNCKFNLLFNANIVFWGWVYGVVDHCTFWRNNTFGVQIHHDAWNNYAYGDGSWADDDYWGSTNAIYIESCSFTNAYAAPGAVDSEAGGRFVFRFNTMTNDYLGTHGTETSGRERSVRSWEIYNNTVYWDTNQYYNYPTGRGTIGCWAFYFRGGTGLVYSNRVYGYSRLMMAAAFRETPSSWYWGAASGQNPWDLNGTNAGNGPGFFYQGTHTGTNNSPILMDATANWAVNQWLTNTGGFMLLDTNTGMSSYIIANSAHTIQYAGPHTGPPLTFNQGDVYQIGYVQAALDQPGYGKGDLIVDTYPGSGIPSNTITAGPGWPHQKLEPIYEWSNSLTGLIGNNLYVNAGGSQAPTIVSNQDWYDYQNPATTAMPSYQPLPYPHPLDTGISSIASTVPGSTNTYLLTVSGGTGGGNYSAGTAVSITANPVSGQTFTSWGGSTNFLASVVSATTTVTMPANAVTVTANYATNSSSQINSTGITNALIAKWTLAGNVSDQVGANNGAAYGLSAFVSGPSGVPGSAISLNGASQYIVTTTLGNFGASCSSGFTLTAWVKSSYTSSYEAIFGSQDGGHGMAVSLYVNFAGNAGGMEAGMIEGLVRDSAGSVHTCDVASNSGITDGNWHFVAWTDNPAANSGTIYVDGVALNTVMTGSAAGATTDLLYPMGLGIRTGLNDGLFNGALADCRIYNQTLSATEVSTLYSNGAATPSAVVLPPSNLQAGPPPVGN